MKKGRGGRPLWLMRGEGGEEGLGNLHKMVVGGGKRRLFKTGPRASPSFPHPFFFSFWLRSFIVFRKWAASAVSFGGKTFFTCGEAVRS